MSHSLHHAPPRVGLAGTSTQSSEICFRPINDTDLTSATTYHLQANVNQSDRACPRIPAQAVPSNVVSSSTKMLYENVSSASIAGPAQPAKSSKLVVSHRLKHRLCDMPQLLYIHSGCTGILGFVPATHGFDSISVGRMIREQNFRKIRHVPPASLGDRLTPATTFEKLMVHDCLKNLPPGEAFRFLLQKRHP